MISTNTGIFTPDSKTIEQVFGDTKAYYSMPEYQRPYSWDDERVNQLWDDLKTAYLNYYESIIANENPIADENYFLGSIILTPGKNCFDVVDGQQRLTTLMIMFCVIRDLYPALNEGDDSDTESISANDIKSFIKNKKNRLHLLTHLNNQNDFEQEIANESIKWPQKFTQADKNNKKYINTAILFKKHFEEFVNENPTKLSSYINYIFKNVRLITIVCSSQAFAIKLFQVLNTRGMDLAPADLIKSYLYGNLSKFATDETIVDQRKAFMQEWNAIEQMLKTTDDSITDMLNMYLYYISNANPRRTLYEELQPYIENKNPNSFLYNLKKFTEDYINIYNTKNQYIYSLFYLQHQLYWKPILTGCKQTNFVSVNEFVPVLSRFYYLFWIAGYTSPKIKQISFNIMKWIKGKVDFSIKDTDNEFEKFLLFTNTIESQYVEAYTSLTDNTCEIDFSKETPIRLLDALNFKLEEKLTLEKVYDYAKSRILDDCYGENWLKPLLILIEYKQVENVDYIALDKNIHAEHIMPQNRDFQYWKDLYSEIEYRERIMKIENLTLLSGTKNIQASNRPFNINSESALEEEKIKLLDEGSGNYHDKLFIYTGKGIDGTTKYRITQYIVDKYTEWNKAEMQERKTWIIDQIEKALKINLTSDKLHQ
ncbi:MAG: hypothetical protein K0S53_809 [Bacteroidetes bacterium]|jgi:uncharacterized protein with ParB-like and HNH nuclease domain|nr:hypothetical protein [Bacteroidota bacterium]